MKMKNVEDLYPLSPMQQAMLAHALYAPTSRVSFEQACDLLQGELHLPAFIHAWEQVMKKHAVLRTAIISKVVEEPLQIVHQRLPLPLQQYDWRDRSEAEQEEALKALLQADQERGFELDKAPLMRMILVQVADEAYYFIWSFHHIILDGWSKDSVMNDFLAHYSAAIQHQEVREECVRPYRDYIAWLQQQDLAKVEEVWRHELKGFTSPTRLPLAHPMTQQTSTERHEERRILCSIETTAALRSLAQRSLVTLNILIQSAWSLFLHYYSGSNDIVFGATVSGRPHSLVGSDAMVGLFINILPIRVHIPDSQDAPALMTWMQAIQARQLELDASSYSPLMHIQEWSEVPWSLPLFESLLVFENYPADSSAEHMQPFKRQNVYGSGGTNHALTVIVEPGEQLTLQMAYDQRSFDHYATEHISNHFHLLLEQIAACAETDQVSTLFHSIKETLDPFAQRQRHADEMAHVEEVDVFEADKKTPAVPPRTPLEFRLVRMWEEILHVHPIGITDNFFELGGHSLSALQLATRMRKEFQQGFPISLLAQIGTVQQLARVLQQQGTIPESPVIALQKGSGVPFFCIHPGSGNILCYYRLVQHLDPDQPFYAIHDLDIQKPEFPEVPIEVMADRYIQAIRQIQPHGPYALGGFSFGGIVAFEMAQQLSKCGQEVQLLALLDTGSPLSTQGFENEDNAGFLSVLTMEAIRTSSPKTAEEVYADLRARTVDEQLHYVVEQMVQAGFDPPENGPLGVRHELQIYKTRTRMIQQYKARIYAGNLTLFQAQEHDGLAPENPLDEDWQRFSCRPIEIYPVPGYHDTILDEPHVQVTAEKLQACLKTPV
jgi:thioesterase domain-containing protein/acyl carrier protein